MEEEGWALTRQLPVQPLIASHSIWDWQSSNRILLSELVLLTSLMGGTLKGWSLTFGEPPGFRSDLINKAFSTYYRISEQKQFFRYCALLCLYLSLDSLGYCLQLTCCRLTSGISSSMSWWFERGVLIPHPLHSGSTETWFEASMCDS